MTSRMFLVSLFLTVVAIPSVSYAQWADLKVRIVYGGTKVPEAKPLEMGKDPWCKENNADAVSEIMMVNPDNMGIQNIAVFVDSKKSGMKSSDVHPDLAEVRGDSVLLDNQKCVFVPRVFAARPKEVVEVKNSDNTGHNASFNFFNNQAQNLMIASNASQKVKLTAVEPAPIPVQCTIHPWMVSYLIVTDHPYVGISDADGVLTITNLPANRPITFKIWHENMNKAIDEVEFAGKPAKWDKGFFELTLKEGMNDLGEIKIAEGKFKK